MGLQRILGTVFVVLGIVALVWGGIFWTDRDTVIDAGPLQVTTAEREGMAVPPLVGALFIAGGVLLLVIPMRRGA